MSIKFLPLKRAVHTALLVLLMSVVGLTNAMAQSFTVGNLNYSVNSDGVSVTLTGHVDGTSATGPLVIPESVTYNGTAYTVKEISHIAFRHNTGLTGDLVIPNSVTTIRSSAFEGCSGFTGVLTIGTSLTTAEDYAFNGCSGLTEIHYNAINCEDSYSVLSYCDGLHTLVIGDNVERIPGGWFSGRAFTGSLTIPNSVTSIGESAFQGCSGFTGSLTIPNSVTSIGQSAFSGCSGFTGSLTIGNSVTIINAYAFSGCRGFTGILTIPNSVTKIYNRAFQNCTGFTGSLVIPNSVTWLSGFNGCTGFTGSLVIPNSVDTIGGYAFQGCTGFTGSLTLGNSVNRIGLYAFQDCTGFLGVLNIPNSVTSIGQHAFEGCSGFMGSLTIPNSVTLIEEEAFSYCRGFTGSLTIGNSVTTIGSSAFNYCSFTGSLTIGNSVTTIGGSAFSRCYGFTGSLTIPNSVTTIGQYAFSGCSGFTGSLTIGNSVTTIGGAAFEGCSGFTGSLTIPNSVTTIGGSAFSGCGGFTGSLVIPNSVLTIDEYAFSGCSGITGNLTIPNSITTIKKGTFSGCSGFTGNLVIPNSVVTIGQNGDVSYEQDGAFYNCSGFTGLTIPNSVMVIGGAAFYGCSGFTGSLTIPNSVTTIGSAAFYGCSGFTGSLTIPNSVTTIGSYAFSGCSGFTGDLVIPNSLFTIKKYAFNNCSGLTSLTIGNSVVTIEEGAFAYCSGFTGALVIPNSVISIGRTDNYVSGAFQNCSGFTSLVLGESLMTIAGNDFRNCTGFTEIYSNNATPPMIIMNNTFSNFSVPVYVPCGSETDYQAATGWNNFTEIKGLCAGTVTVEANPAEGGTVAGGGYYESGTQCTVTAVANEGFAFANWTKNGVVASTNATYTFPVAGDMTLVANFLQDGNIVFADANVKAICVEHWDTNGDGELSYVEAASVSSLEYYFEYNEEITSFDELQYFIGLNSIGDYAFYYCSGLTSIVLPSSITTIGYYAFYYSDLQSIITLALTPPVISGYYTFSGLYDILLFVPCGALEAYQNADYWSNFSNIVSEPSRYFVQNGLRYEIISSNPPQMRLTGFAEGITTAENIVIPASIHSDCSESDYTVTEIADEAFMENLHLTGTLDLPSTLTRIGNSAFDGCEGLTGTLVIPENMGWIGQWAFYACGFTSIQYNATNCTMVVNAYEEAPFLWCSQLQEIAVGDNVTNIPDYAFYKTYAENCQLVLGNGVQTIGKYAFGNVNDANKGLSGELVIPASVTDIGHNAFCYNYNLTGDLVIPENINKIGKQAFIYCGITSIHYNATDCVSIGLNDEGTWNFAFWNCTQLEEIVIGDNVTQIPIYAFANTNAQNCRVDLGTGVATINNYAFYNGTSNPTYSIKGALVIPASVGTIGYCAFYGCSGLTEIWSKRPSAPYIQFNTFTDVDNSIPVHVPCGSTSSYQYSNYWSAFTNYVENPAVLIARSNNELLGMATVTKYGDCNDNVSIVQAMPSIGTFANWTTPDGTVVSTNATFSFALTQDMILTANFYELSGDVYAFVGGSTTNHWSDPNNWIPNELPTETSSVNILANAEVNVDANVNSVTIFGSHIVKINSGAILTVTDMLTTPTATSIVVEEGGQLVHSNDGVMATVKRIVTPYTDGERDGWHLIATPLFYNVYIYDIENLTSNEYDLYYYDEPSVYWINQEDGNNYYEEMEVGKGYLYGNNQNVTLSFSGYLQNGSATVNVPLSYTTGHALQGFNLVGNPFAHNVTSYASVNVANGCYVMNEAKDDLIVSEISEESPLKPAEGFFVKATAAGASITFNPGRGSTATQSGTIRVELEENGKLIDRLLVKTDEGQPLEKFSLNERRTRLFAQGERQELAIVPCEGNEQAVNFKAAKNGQYTISVNVDGMDFSYLHLIDNLTGADVNLLDEPSYTFEAKTSDYASRFLLRFIPKDGSSTSSETFAFISNGNIVITDADANATLQIVDVTGRVVVSSDAARNVSTSGMSAGVYVLRLINGNDVRTQKIVVE